MSTGATVPSDASRMVLQTNPMNEASTYMLHVCTRLGLAVAPTEPLIKCQASSMVGTSKPPTPFPNSACCPTATPPLLNCSQLYGVVSCDEKHMLREGCGSLPPMSVCLSSIMTQTTEWLSARLHCVLTGGTGAGAGARTEEGTEHEQGQGQEEGQEPIKGQGGVQGEAQGRGAEAESGTVQGQGWVQGTGKGKGNTQGKGQKQGRGRAKVHGQGQGRGQGQGQGHRRGQGKRQGKGQEASSATPTCLNLKYDIVAPIRKGYSA